MLTYKRLVSANNDLTFAIMMSTLKGMMETRNDVKSVMEMQKAAMETQMETQKDVMQIQKDFGIYAINLKLKSSRTENIMLESKNITELRNQPQVKRGKVVKKKYLTQDVAQKLIPIEMSLKMISILKLLDGCKNVVKL